MPTIQCSTESSLLTADVRLHFLLPQKDNCQYWHGDLPQGSSGSGGGSVQQLVLPYGSDGQPASALYARQQEEITALLQGTFLEQEQRQQAQQHSSATDSSQHAHAPQASLSEPSYLGWAPDAAAQPQQAQQAGKAGRAAPQAGPGSAAGAASSSGSGSRPQLVISEMMRDLMHRRFNSLLW